MNFFKLNWIHRIVFFTYKILTKYGYYYCVLGRRDFFFHSALLLSIITHFVLRSSAGFLSYFTIAVPMRECLREHSCMSSQFPVAIPNGTPFFRESTCSKWSKRHLSKTNNNGNNKLLRLNKWCLWLYSDYWDLLRVQYWCSDSTVHEFQVFFVHLLNDSCFLVMEVGGEECLHLFQLI